ncbi:MAG: RnfH family protein [Xanthomonadales bacterium]|nr:RnfH family protein [Xanthomonadales bacterium]
MAAEPAGTSAHPTLAPAGAPLSPAPNAETIRVEVTYARPERAWRVSLTLPAGTTALQAFEASGLRVRVVELARSEPDLGVFAQAVGPGHVLRDGDRVEVYRPLLIDPKDARRKRAAQT